MMIFLVAAVTLVLALVTLALMPEKSLRGRDEDRGAGSGGVNRKPSSTSIVNAELLLQAGRRGRVLEHDALAGADDALGRLRHQRRLMEAGQDQLQLARIRS